MPVNLLGAFAELPKVTTRLVMPVRQSAWNSAPTGRILTKFDVWEFFETLPRKFKFQRLKSEKNDGHFAIRPLHIYNKPISVRSTMKKWGAIAQSV